MTANGCQEERFNQSFGDVRWGGRNQQKQGTGGKGWGEEVK